MLNLKVNDLPLRGRGFTLLQAASNHGVDEDLFDSLILAAYNSVLPATYSPAQDEDNPDIPDCISVKSYKDRKYSIEDLIKNGLVTQTGDKLVFTEKTVSIFEEAVKIDKKLRESGFYFCPCHMI